MVIPFHKRQILDASKLKEFADKNSKFNENVRKSMVMWESSKLPRKNIVQS